MSQVNGTVEKVFRNSAGFYNVKLPNGWFGTGSKDAPSFKEGDIIEAGFTTNARGYNNLEMKTLVVHQPTATNTSTAPQTNTYTVRQDNRQDSIVWQSSRKDAIEVIKLGIESGAITLPAKKADKYDALLAYIEEVTKRYAWEASNPEIEEPDNSKSASNDLPFDDELENI